MDRSPPPAECYQLTTTDAYGAKQTYWIVASGILQAISCWATYPQEVKSGLGLSVAIEEVTGSGLDLLLHEHKRRTVSLRVLLSTCAAPAVVGHRPRHVNRLVAPLPNTQSTAE